MDIHMNNNYSLARGSTSYKEALLATESIEPPGIGFAKPSEYQGAVSGNSTIIKQNNIQIQLLVQITEGNKGGPQDHLGKRGWSKQSPLSRRYNNKAEQFIPWEKGKTKRSEGSTKGLQGSLRNSKRRTRQTEALMASSSSRTVQERLLDANLTHKDQIWEYQRNQRRIYNSRRLGRRIFRRQSQ